MKGENVMKVVYTFQAINNRSTNMHLFPTWEWAKTPQNNLPICTLNIAPFPTLVPHNCCKN